MYPVVLASLLTFTARQGYLFDSTTIKVTVAVVVCVMLSGAIHLYFSDKHKKNKKPIGLAVNCNLGLWCALLLSLLLLRQPWLNVDLYRINGDSMRPTLKPGDVVLIETLSPNARLQSNDILVFYPAKSRKTLIKRYTPIEQSEQDNQSSLYLLGDNPHASLDSRMLGRIARTQVVGKARRLVWSDGEFLFQRLSKDSNTH